MKMDGVLRSSVRVLHYHQEVAVQFVVSGSYIDVEIAHFLQEEVEMMVRTILIDGDRTWC
jgi:hypothetical protein